MADRMMTVCIPPPRYDGRQIRVFQYSLHHPSIHPFFFTFTPPPLHHRGQTLRRIRTALYSSLPAGVAVPAGRRTTHLASGIRRFARDRTPSSTEVEALAVRWGICRERERVACYPLRAGSSVWEQPVSWLLWVDSQIGAPGDQKCGVWTQLVGCRSTLDARCRKARPGQTRVDR